MSTTAQPSAPAPPVPREPERSEITVVSHSNLFYWWPVWAVAFLMAILTYIDGHLMVTVPKDSRAADSPTVTIKKPDGGKEELLDQEVIVLGKKDFAREDATKKDSQPRQPYIHMAKS